MNNNKTNKLSTKSKQVSEPLETSGKHIPDPKFKRFYLEREKDMSGISGTGVVAEGVQFSNGSCILCWIGVTSCTSIWHSIYEMIAVHGHENTTKIVWID